MLSNRFNPRMIPEKHKEMRVCSECCDCRRRHWQSRQFLREAGRGSLWISLRRSLPNATLTERLHRSIRESGSAGGEKEGDKVKIMHLQRQKLISGACISRAKRQRAYRVMSNNIVLTGGCCSREGSRFSGLQPNFEL